MHTKDWELPQDLVEQRIWVLGPSSNLCSCAVPGRAGGKPQCARGRFFCLLKMPLQIQRELSACSQISGTRNCLGIFEQTELCLCTPPSHCSSFLQPHLLVLPLPCSSSCAACSAACTAFHPKRKGENSSVLPHGLLRSEALALCEQTLHKLNLNSRRVFTSTLFLFGFNFKCPQSRFFKLGMLHLQAVDGPRFSLEIQAFGAEGWDSVDAPSGFSSFGTVFPCSVPDRHLKEFPFPNFVLY